MIIAVEFEFPAWIYVWSFGDDDAWDAGILRRTDLLMSNFQLSTHDHMSQSQEIF